jgi:hypothetical protein
VRRVPFSCLVRSKSFSAVSRATCPIFMFCAPGLIFGGTEGVGSHFHVLLSRTYFRRYGGRQVSFSCFARSDTFSAEMRVSGVVFMFCAPGLVSHGTEGVGSRFQVLRSRTRFHRYRWHQVPFSSFPLRDSFSALPDSFSALPDLFSSVRRASSLVFMFCALRLVFSSTEGVGSHFHVLRARTRFRWYGGHQFPFTCFARTDSFSAIPRSSGAVFMFCTPGHIFGGGECVRSCFHVLRAQTGFGDLEGDESRFHVLRAGISFR